MGDRRLILLIPPHAARVKAIRVRGAVVVLLALVIAGGFAGYFIPFNHFALDKVKLNEKNNLERINQDLLYRMVEIRKLQSGVRQEIQDLTRKREWVAPRNGRSDEEDDESKRTMSASMLGVDELLGMVLACENKLLELSSQVDSQPSYFEYLPVLLPVVGTPVLSVPYGKRRDPFTGGVKWHHGVDLVAARGTPVVAAARGTVYDIDDDKRWGKVVRIRHQHGFTTVYAHLGSITVRRHARVKRGEQIGTIGSTGFSTGPHLHYEIRRNGKPLDPQIVFYPALDSMLSRAGDLELH